MPTLERREHGLIERLIRPIAGFDERLLI